MMCECIGVVFNGEDGYGDMKDECQGDYKYKDDEYGLVYYTDYYTDYVIDREVIDDEDVYDDEVNVGMRILVYKDQL
ncbi:MAG: hypothetical protein EZS28_003974 [Streblomastix strix]|uniref:Uncharacterized protein n=1 Tax=Streblomastix strix TaxID=222440 RepID=A0A5J4X0C1_9EUKA|nr:MAG: hypothetical protein EZS28_003974 [Streblomastix strix]